MSDSPQIGMPGLLMARAAKPVSYRIWTDVQIYDDGRPTEYLVELVFRMTAGVSERRRC